MKTLFIGSLLLLSLSVSGQVDEIKSASKENSSRSRSGGSSDSGGGSSGGFSFVSDLLFSGIFQWQGTKLSDD